MGSSYIDVGARRPFFNFFELRSPSSDIVSKALFMELAPRQILSGEGIANPQLNPHSCHGNASIIFTDRSIALPFPLRITENVPEGQKRRL